MAALLGLAMLLAFVPGCRTTSSAGPSTTLMPAPPAKPRPRPPVPALEDINLALVGFETRRGVRLLRNSRSQFAIFLTPEPDRFSVADAARTCLYDVTVLDGGSKRVPTISVTRSLCGMSGSSIRPEIRAQALETARRRWTEILEPRLQGAPWPKGCSAGAFVELTQNIPFRVAPGGTSVEHWISDVADPVLDPFDLAFGDILFVGPPSRALPGFYAGHGIVIVHDDCDDAEIHRLRPDLGYRAYRLATGFSWADVTPALPAGLATFTENRP